MLFVMVNHVQFVESESCAFISSFAAMSQNGTCVERKLKKSFCTKLVQQDFLLFSCFLTQNDSSLHIFCCIFSSMVYGRLKTKPNWWQPTGKHIFFCKKETMTTVLRNTCKFCFWRRLWAHMTWYLFSILISILLIVCHLCFAHGVSPVTGFIILEG